MAFNALPKSFLRFVILFSLSFSIAGCNPTGGYRSTTPEFPSAVSVTPDTYSIDPVFVDFYAYFGEVISLGPAITPLFEEDNLKKQYVEAGLIVYDPGDRESGKYRLFPLGNDFGIAEPPVDDPGLQESRFINGHVVYGDFLNLYEQLGGARFVGLPLTEARHNTERGRVEQYFENLGFYRLDDDPSGSVQLLSYGVLSCDKNCRYQAPSSSIPSTRPVLTEPFAAEVARLGGLPYVGLTLSDPYLAGDGRMEVIFENLVLVTESGDQERVIVRPIVEMVGIQVQPPVDQVDNTLMEFIPLFQGKGHHVPHFFLSFLERLGGLEFSGPPTTEVFPVSNGVYRQCFTTLCLDFEVDNQGERRMKLAPLGVIYKEKYYQQAGDFTRTQSLKDIDIKVWEGNPSVTSDQYQEIHAVIFENNYPLINREPIIIVTLPDTSTQIYHFQPTNANGHTSIIIPSVPAPNGTLIAYEVCLVGISDEVTCVGDHYLIWNHPS